MHRDSGELCSGNSKVSVDTCDVPSTAAYLVNSYNYDIRIPLMGN